MNNGTHGVDHQFGTNVRFIGGTITGNSVGMATNTQAYAINVAAGAGANFIITGTTPSLLARLRLGTAGTTADTQVCATVAAVPLIPRVDPEEKQPLLLCGVI